MNNNQIENKIEVCKGKCPNLSGKCPNVKPYADGSRRYLHTETKCAVCGDRWLWGLSWDGSMDGKFNCGHKVENTNKTDMAFESEENKKENCNHACTSNCRRNGCPCDEHDHGMSDAEKDMEAEAMDKAKENE